MDAQQFLAEFGHIANAAGGVDRLRDLVLELAIQGRLVSSDQNGLSTLELFAEIRQWRAENVSSARGRRTLDHPSVDDREKAYGIPSHWVWIRNADLFCLIKGKNPKDLGASGKYAYLDIEALDRGNVQKYTNDERMPRTTDSDILVVCDGSRSGLVLDGKVGVIGSTLARIVTFEPIKPFVRLIFLHGYRRLNSEKKGAAIPHLDTARLLASPCGLPPLEEQGKIIAKVDELMVLCDKLEAQQQDRRKFQNTLRLATLQAVATGTNSHELRTAWARLEANFGKLFSAPEDVRPLRDTVFDLALRGTLLANAKVNKTAELSSDQAAPLPEGWQWKTLADLSEYITSGSRGWKVYMSNVGDVFIRSQDIKHDALVFENPAFVSLPEKAEGKRTLVREGDLLMTITGANVGKCATVPALEQDAYVSQHVALIRLREVWLTDFIHFWMINSFGGRRFLSQYIYGDKPGLNLTQVGSVPIPVPPEEICVEIMSSLRSYRQVCDQLERQLRSKQELASVLAVATVSSITGIANEKEEDPMKAPQTELIALLRLGQTPNIKDQAPLATILARHNGEISAKDLWQRFGGEIDAFYAQLKTEVAHGWILEPAVAEMREKQPDMVNA